MKVKESKSLFILALLFATTVIAVFPTKANSVVTSRTYTLDEDFDEGTLVGVEHETVHDQLQLSKEQITLPFIWIPNLQGTVSKIHTETGKELGRYWVAPYAASPSRTTVDLQGNCWVGNREAGTVVKIGLLEAGAWIDRNGNGVPDTSQDLDDNGNIDPGEILPWGQDECVLYEVVLILGKEGTYAPGTYTGGYDTNNWGTSPRGLAIDSSNNLWAGTWITKKFYYIDGSTGAILRTENAPISSYGAIIDGNGILWSSGQSSTYILRLDPSTTPATMNLYGMGHFVYGLGMDQLNHLFVSGWTDSRTSRVDVTTSIKEWTKLGPYSARGVACTGDNNVWIASTDYDRVFRYDNDGNYITNIITGNGPTGVAVDAAGKVWTCHLNDETIARIDPTTNTVDLTKQILGSAGHYGYSDMTGILARTVTTKIGTWTVDFDSEKTSTPWGKVSWNSDEPLGTSVTVRVRSSEDKTSWSPWETAANDVMLSSTPNGRYLQIETTLQITSGETSPILYDLTVEIGNLPPVADAGPDQTVEQTSHAGAEITLDGSESSDPDGDPLTYIWTWTGGSATGVEPTVIFPLGTTIVTLTVSDGMYTDDDTTIITVTDTTPPEIIMSNEPIILWPPNHKYHTISVSDFIIEVSDICDADVGIDNVIITAVTSDEPENAQGKGDGNTVNDILILDSQTVKLRAERQGNGNGRVYTIYFMVEDESGNIATGSFEIWVPHDNGHGSTPINDGTAYVVNYVP
ncbi:MAG: PKD domain-containing protein [Candidatus Hodarchaeota archaeon]